MLNLCNNSDQTLFYHPLMFARSLGFQHFPLDCANINEWKIIFDPSIEMLKFLFNLIFNTLSHLESDLHAGANTTARFNI